ncbi:hypothetical protein ACFQ05_35855 [Amycolatopsis umgeniensis]|uniref:Carbohydrate kinase PfkB domain-containing protein n=1 Tax=Amycolatopsis umgeniensis TaxID=336628 RepID=A0A841B6F9_9PSEU|nr:hypothetical protein [Amycolatopsis umgeniensis]MBB5855666.1 hypothetical protein [Amycolatopsis umgeniensis]
MHVITTALVSMDFYIEVTTKFLAVLVAGFVVRVLRGPILRRGRILIKSGPDWLERAVSRQADRLYPSWRIKTGIRRRQVRLEWRFRTVRRLLQRRRGYFILGGVYLDLLVRPIGVKQLENKEYSNLDRVHCSWGGSACYVGYYLYENFGKKSYLYSRIGGLGMLSRELKKLLRQEPWIKRGRYGDGDPSVQSGVSIHLKQKGDDYRTTFTHKGALEGLSWGPVLSKLVKKTGRGGVLHISGYFRTGLHKELCDSLQRLSPNLIVCVDHGRFLPEDHAMSAQALLDAFSRQLIDVYISTPPELHRLMALADVDVDEELPTVEKMKIYARRTNLLPRVTVVRGEVTAESVTSYVVIDGHLLDPVTVEPGLPPSHDVPGKNNAFNAALAYHLSNGDPDEPMVDLVRDAVERALRAWVENVD